MSEKDEQVVSQTPKKKTHTGKKKRGRFGRAVRKADQRPSWSSRFSAARACLD